MKKILAVVVALGALLSGYVALAPGASAITNGTIDGNKHPQVGLIYAPWKTVGVNSPLCSGTLIAKDVFLTAGHCFDGNLPSMGARDVYVSFDSQRTANPNLVRGTWSRPADYHAMQNDVAIIKLDKAITNVTPLALAKAGALDAMVANKTLTTSPFTSVGFGFTAIVQGSGDFSDPYRRYSVGQGTTLTSVALKLTQLNNAKYNFGGSCNGDSGGPVLDSSKRIVGIISTGDANCTSTGVAFRTDIAKSRAFIGKFVTLP